MNLKKFRLAFSVIFSFIFISLSSQSFCGSRDGDDEYQKRRERAEKAAAVEKYPPHPWKMAYKYKSKSYLVTTNTSKRTASYIGQLMDYAQKNYRIVFGYKGKIKRLNINAYRTFDEYVKYGDGSEDSSGCFKWRGLKSRIEIPYIDKWGKTYPTEVLLHEGTHQFVHEVIDFKLPKKFRHFFKNTLYMNVVPRWLNEGMATYMEVSYYNGKRLVVGEINRRRLRYLQRTIQRNESITLRDLFKPRSSEEFIEDSCYSPSWGLIYWFLHDKSRKMQRKKRKMLKEYIDWCKKGFMENPEEDFERLFVEDGKLCNNFWSKWRKFRQEEGMNKFIDVTIKDKEKIEEWEEMWRKYILQLDPNDRWGGLRRKKRR
jgi:hypothetical protein